MKVCVPRRELAPFSSISTLATPTMTNPFEPLSDDELQELDNFLLYEVDCDESMTLDMLDGYLHAIAIGRR